MSATNLCGDCGKPASLACQRCMIAFYCNKTCSTKAWPLHKVPCKATCLLSGSHPTFTIHHRTSGGTLTVKLTFQILENRMVRSTETIMGKTEVKFYGTPEEALQAMVACWVACMGRSSGTPKTDLFDISGAILIGNAENPDSLEKYIRKAWGMAPPNW